MARSGVAEDCATYLASEYKTGASRRDLIFFTIPIATIAVCDIQRGLLHQCTANVQKLVFNPTLTADKREVADDTSGLWVGPPFRRPQNVQERPLPVQSHSY
jgi:hypothetical protein